MDSRQASTAVSACPICGKTHGDECPSVTMEDQKRGYEIAGIVFDSTQTRGITPVSLTWTRGPV